MVVLPFDAITSRFEWKRVFPTPLEYAQHMWDRSENIDDFNTACELAIVDCHVYDALKEWVHQQDELPTEVKARLFDVYFYNERPKKRNATARRNAYLKYMINELVEHYDLTPTRDQSRYRDEKNLSKITSAPEIIAQVPGTPDVGTIQQALYKK